MTTTTIKQRFHVWLLPLVWMIPAFYLAFQRSEKISHRIFDSFTGRWIRTWFDLTGSYAYDVVPLAAGVIECVVFGFLMDWFHIRRWIYAFTTPFVLLGLWGSIPPAGSFAIFCVFICWGLYAVGLLSVAGGLTLRIIRRIRPARA